MSSVATAQGISLENKLDRPFLYLAQRAPEKGGEDVLSAIHDSVAASMLGVSKAGERNLKEVDAGGAVLRSVQQLLSRLSVSSDASELALVGLMNLGARRRPLIVFHTQLRENGLAEIRDLLTTKARKTRTVHGRQVYEFKTADFKAGDAGLAGLEIALVARDLVVSNDEATMGRVLDPRTVAGGGFTSSPRFKRLRSKLDVPPGSIMLYADWEALQPEIDKVFGNAGWLLANSGIEVPDQLMFVAKPAPSSGNQARGIVTTVLLNHSGDSHKFATGAKETLPAWRHDGWLDLLMKARVGKLLRELPRGGVAAMASQIDIDRLLPVAAGERMPALQATLFDHARRMHINLKSQVLPRLRKSGALQLLMVGGKNSAPNAAYSLRAKNTKSARELFDILVRGFERRRGRQSRSVRAEFSEVGGHGMLHIQPHHADGLYLSVVRDSLILAASPAVIAEVRELADKAKTRTAAQARRASTYRKRLERLGGSSEKAHGVVALDLSFLAKKDAAKNDKGKSSQQPASAKGKKASASTTTGSGIFGLHAGFISFERDLVRLRLFTELPAR